MCSDFNYSKEQNIENTSQDFIHCKMQGALKGKTMHVVCASFVLFTEIVYTTQLYNHYRIIVAENSVKYVPVDGLFGIQILPDSISPGALPRSRPGELTTSPKLLDAFSVSPTVPRHFSKPFAARFDSLKVIGSVVF